MITIITSTAPLSHSWATERYAKIMKPFCLGYISQVMWRLFVTFPRNGAGTCIPHPGPGLPADSTGHSFQLSNFPSTAQWRSCLCCQSRPGKVLLSKTNWRSQFRKFFCEAQARVRQGSARYGKGWQSRRKALKLKPLPWAYTKFGWPTFPPPSHPEVSLSPGLS